MICLYKETKRRLNYGNNNSCKWHRTTHTHTHTHEHTSNDIAVNQGIGAFFPYKKSR